MTTMEKSSFHFRFSTPGDAILIHGLVVHKSEQNKSEKSRHIYTFHIFDQGTTTWSKKNWYGGLK